MWNEINKCDQGMDGRQYGQLLEVNITGIATAREVRCIHLLPRAVLVAVKAVRITFEVLEEALQLETGALGLGYLGFATSAGFDYADA